MLKMFHKWKQPQPRPAIIEGGEKHLPPRRSTGHATDTTLHMCSLYTKFEKERRERNTRCTYEEKAEEGCCIKECSIQYTGIILIRIEPIILIITTAAIGVALSLVMMTSSSSFAL